MNIEELKKLRQKNFSKHKEKKRTYYLKNKIKKKINNEDKLKEDSFLKKTQVMVDRQRPDTYSRLVPTTKKIEENQLVTRAY